MNGTKRSKMSMVINERVKICFKAVTYNVFTVLCLIVEPTQFSVIIANHNKRELTILIVQTAYSVYNTLI